MIKHLALLCVLLAGPSQAADSSYLAGLGGAKLRDAGVLSMDGGAYARTEVFEYLDMPDGGHVLLNTITAANGQYRVQVRFDMDKDWRSVSAHGQGLYDGTPVTIHMAREGDTVAIRVTGDGIDLSPRAECAPDCFINMSPSATAMFMMTRFYDMAKGGAQPFLWAGQDLDRKRTLSGGISRLSFKAARPVKRLDGSTLDILHFTFVEDLPDPRGGRYLLDFDLWVDTEHRPMGFRVTSKQFTVTGFRGGFEDVKATLTKAD
jgi:hypothetical protein